MNESKARLQNLVLFVSSYMILTLCNWVWPNDFISTSEKRLQGWPYSRAQYMTAITGDQWSMEDLDFAAEKEVCNFLGLQQF